MSLAIFKNLDKADWQEDEQWKKKWDPSDPSTLLNFPTCKMLLCARPNSGKTNFIKNIITHNRKLNPVDEHDHGEFSKIIIVHHDQDTSEYDDLLDDENIILTTEIPSVDDFDKNQKQCCVMDDVYTGRLNKEDEKKLNKLFTYISSHRNCTVIISCHDYTTIPPPVRRSIDVFVLWKLIDFESQKLLAKKFGISNTGLYELFRNPDLIKSKYDCLVVDLLPDSPAKFRLNGVQPLDPKVFNLEGNDALDDEIDKRNLRKSKLQNKSDVLVFKR